MQCPAFLELIYDPSIQQHRGWSDNSTDRQYRFSSVAGGVQLLKRNTYPETFAYITGDLLTIDYGCPPQGDEAMMYDDEFLVITINTSMGEISVQRDVFATTPLFIGYSGTTIVLSNRFDRVCTLLPQVTPNHVAIGLFLAGAIIHPATIFNEIQILGERSTAHWRKGSLNITTPPDGVLPVVLTEHASNPAAVSSVLERTFDAYWNRYGQGQAVGAELSCGVDSSLIVGYFADKKLPILPSSLIQAGAAGISLESRLQEFEVRFSIKSHRIFMNPETEYLLAPMDQSDDWHPFFYDHELYDISFTKLADHLAENGVKTLFTGIGGDDIQHTTRRVDEIMRGNALHEFLEAVGLPSYLTKATQQLETIEPPLTKPQILAVPIQPFSVHRAHINRNNIYIDRGIWPIAPLADPYLYSYFQTLPIRFRINKNIFRAYLQSRAFPGSIISPQSNEDFGEYFRTYMNPVIRRYVERFLHNSRLQQLGYVDEVLINKALTRALQANGSIEAGDILVGIYNVIVVEILLRVTASVV